MKLLVLCFIQISYGIARHWKLEDLNTVSLIQYHGYEVEIHKVVTEDGYLLQMHRIPHNRFSNVTGRPVFLQHGLSCASDFFVMRTPDKDLAYILSDAGYDVWFGNSRGNPYSPGYVDASNSTFWNFSYHELGVYDLPAEIDYILQKTGHTNLSFVGHSVGATIAFVLLSENPKYNDKINVIIGFGPSAFISQSWYLRKLYTRIFARIIPILYRFLADKFLLVHGIDMRSEARLMELFDKCGENSTTREECINRYLTHPLTNREQMDPEYILPIKSLVKSGTSVKVLIHLCQNSVTNNLQKFDFGRKKNIEVYGVKKAPLYNLRSITTPLALYVAPHDEVVSFESSKRLAREFKNLYRFYVVNNDKFNHRDFIFAKDAKSLVYDDVLKVFNECIDKGYNCNMSSQDREELDIKFNSDSITTNNKHSFKYAINSKLKHIFSSLKYRQYGMY